MLPDIEQAVGIGGILKVGTHRQHQQLPHIALGKCLEHGEVIVFTGLPAFPVSECCCDFLKCVAFTSVFTALQPIAVLDIALPRCSEAFIVVVLVAIIHGCSNKAVAHSSLALVVQAYQRIEVAEDLGAVDSSNAVLHYGFRIVLAHRGADATTAIDVEVGMLTYRWRQDTLHNAVVNLAVDIACQECRSQS